MKLICTLLLSSVFLNSYASQISDNDPLHLGWLDTKISSDADFYDFANGTWIKQNPIPADYSSWGSFSVLQEQNRDRIHKMLKNASKDKNVKPGSIEQKVGDFYFSGMDVDSINKLGLEPLKNEFAKINSIKNVKDLEKAITHLHQLGVMVVFGFSSMQDFKDSTKVIAAVEQSGLSLPNKDYYLKQDEKFKHIREEYIKHMTKMFVLFGDTEQLAKENANTVMRMEMEFAKASMGQIEQRDPDAVYHLMDLKQLTELTPNFSWRRYFNAMGKPLLSNLNMAMPDFMRAVNSAMIDFSISDWKTYLTWHLLDSSAPYLSKPFVMQNFQMASVLSGTKTIPLRWKRVVGTESNFLGFAVGELYVEKYFSLAAKNEAVNMIKNIRSVLRSDLKQLSWMTTKTKKEALKKLDLIEDRVGYPDKWRDYSTLKIDRGPYILNILRASQFLIKRDLDKIGKPVDRDEWEMTPQTVNAYYHPSMNSINIPMGILQPPYFDPKAPEAVNYGAIGVVIGHEITHGFDDQGAKFDANGNLQNWWSDEDLKKFQIATQCIVDQYSKYKVNNEVPVQGKLVVGEATADLGGLILAYKAFHASDKYKTAPTINGYTPDQQFFISFAHIWANNMRPEQAMNLVTLDPHPPSKYRVNGTLANMPQFQQAFNISDNSAMVNVKRCVIW